MEINHGHVSFGVQHTKLTPKWFESELSCNARVFGLAILSLLYPGSLPTSTSARVETRWPGTEPNNTREGTFANRFSRTLTHGQPSRAARARAREKFANRRSRSADREESRSSLETQFRVIQDFRRCQGYFLTDTVKGPQFEETKTHIFLNWKCFEESQNDS